MEVEAESSSITSLALVRLQTESRLLKTACSPDKDLVVILSKVGGEEKMSLWKLTGSKRWEIDMSLGGTASEEITALGWSPDGNDCFILCMRTSFVTSVFHESFAQDR